MKINNFLLKASIEKIGLSEKFPIAFLREIIYYTEDSNRLLSLGIKKQICHKVRELYYNGYNDLSLEEGVVQILKDIEIQIGNDDVFEILEGYTENPIHEKVIDIATYLKTITITKGALKSLLLGNKKRIKSITDLNSIQLMSPMFEYKLVQKQFKYRPRSKQTFDNIIILEDTTNSMIRSVTIEKVIGIFTAIKISFPNSTITKYHCYQYQMDLVKIDTVSELTHAGKFCPDFYLEHIDQCDLVIIVTNAYKYEMQDIIANQSTIIFNLGKSDYPIINNTLNVSI